MMDLGVNPVPDHVSSAMSDKMTAEDFDKLYVKKIGGDRGIYLMVSDILGDEGDQYVRMFSLGSCQINKIPISVYKKMYVFGKPYRAAWLCARQYMGGDDLGLNSILNLFGHEFSQEDLDVL